MGKGLAIFFLIPLLGWATLMFVTILMLLSCSCSMFALVLQNVPKGHILICAEKYGLKVHFSCLFIALGFFSPPPTNLPAFWPVCLGIMINLGCCSLLCEFSTCQTSFHLFLLVPISNLQHLLGTRFAGQIRLVLSLIFLIVVQCTPCIT